MTSGSTEQWPTVGVVVPTHNRPELLRETLRAILDQDAPAPLDVVVVFDRSTPDTTLEALSRPDRRVRVVANTRTPGLAGARNTGILALETEWVAFCDDDDTWDAGKLRAQLERAGQRPEADVITTAIRVAYEGEEGEPAKEMDRLAGTDRIEHTQLVRTRMAMLHSSSLLLRRTALMGRLGLVDERLPGSQNEDWDMLLRSAALAPIEHVDEPLVRVRWGRTSHFSRNWQTHVDSLEWMLDHHPEIEADDRGAARVFGQLAFGWAALGDRGRAARWARRAVRRNWREPRVPISVAVMLRIASPEGVLSFLNGRGKGL